MNDSTSPNEPVRRVKVSGGKSVREVLDNGTPEERAALAATFAQASEVARKAFGSISTLAQWHQPAAFDLPRIAWESPEVQTQRQIGALRDEIADLRADNQELRRYVAQIDNRTRRLDEAILGGDSPGTAEGTEPEGSP